VLDTAREGPDTARLKRELLLLVVIVLLIDGGFIASIASRAGRFRQPPCEPCS
jgi:hypothetical protein